MIYPSYGKLLSQKHISSVSVLQLQEGKENGVATEDDLQYADLDKSAMSSGT